jgi:hypothetical protein
MEVEISSDVPDGNRDPNVDAEEALSTFQHSLETI